MRRAAPFVMAMLLATLMPLSAEALFGGKRDDTAAKGAPIAQEMEIRAYRGVAYTGTLKAVDNESGTLTFQVVDAPQKGTLELGEEGVFVYTPDRNKAGGDRFTFTATDEDGNVSLPATVKIKIERVSSGVSYADTDGSACATAAIDLAEHGVFVGAKVGGGWFFEPERTVSRGEFTAMAMAAAGIAPSDVTVTGFCDDEAIPTWAKGSAAGALAAGLVCGVPTENGTAFAAERDVTISEAAAIVNRVLCVTDVDPAAFENGEPVWYAQAVANLESVSVAPAGGFDAQTLDHAITRGEAAELLSAAMALAEARAESESFWSKFF
ncbi:MAG: S-layer homology domain-containing protein [Oscillospiraceae bacterium]|nr:S-layer homology domain-containing protein [Oscillospiraceae bacterium]